MKNLKKWMLVLTLAGPMVTNFSCLSGLTRTVFTAAMDGASSFVEGTTFDFLAQTVNLGGAGG